MRVSLLNLPVGICSRSRAAGTRACKVRRHAAPAGSSFHLLAFECAAEDDLGRVASQSQGEREAELVSTYPALEDRNRAYGAKHRAGNAGERSAERAIG